MMLPTQGPTTTLQEDLQILKIVEGDAEPAAKSNETLGRESDARGGDYAGPPGKPEAPLDNEGDDWVDAGDSAGGGRVNVPVRKDGGAKKAALAQDAWDDEDDDYVVSENRGSGKMVPSFLIPTEAEIAEAEEQAEYIAEEDRLARAWDVVNTYFTEDEDGLNEEGLRGVINAMGYALNVAVEDIAALTVDNDRLSEAVHELTGLLSEDEDEDEDEAKDDDEDDDEDEDKLPAFLKKRGQEESYGRRANLQEDEDLRSLASELSSLGESRAAKAIDKQAKLIEAYEEVRDACASIVERIVDVIADDAGLAEGEDLAVDERDERVQIARFFEGIYEDAAYYLSRLADGDVPFKMAEADLSKLCADMEKGIGAMHTVE